MEFIYVKIVVKRYSDNDMESATNDQPGNTFKVHAKSLRSESSDFFVAEEDLQQISQMRGIVSAYIPSLANPSVIVYYFGRNRNFVPINDQEDFDIFLNTRTYQHIYVVQVPPSSMEFIITTYDSKLTIECETNDHDGIDTVFTTDSESDCEDLDGEVLHRNLMEVNGNLQEQRVTGG